METLVLVAGVLGPILAACAPAIGKWLLDYLNNKPVRQAQQAHDDIENAIASGDADAVNRLLHDWLPENASAGDTSGQSGDPNAGQPAVHQ